MVRTGLERLVEQPPSWMKTARIGLLCNPASVDANLIHARMRIQECSGGNLSAMFSPQHGFFAEKQDNMVESDHFTDPVLGIPVFSLYGDTRIPTEEMFSGIDLLLVDLQDAGCRVYTFATTLSYCMETAKKCGVRVVVLDRPNPVGGEMVEGNCLKPAWTSFVGRFPIPMRHGMTLGELALMMNNRFGIACELEVIPMNGWRRSMMFSDTGLPWVAPSPNLPTVSSALVYPGQVIWEGTNVSEGRGTTQPFELFGAPFIDPHDLSRDLEGTEIPGAVLRPVAFEPMFQKWAGKRCGGFQIHVIRPSVFQSFRTSLLLLGAIMKRYPDQFEWKPPPYEYETERMPIDLILGDGTVRRKIESLMAADALAASWADELARFESLRENCLLYA